jgi:hypothetical protein
MILYSFVMLCPVIHCTSIMLDIAHCQVYLVYTAFQELITCDKSKQNDSCGSVQDCI